MTRTALALALLAAPAWAPAAWAQEEGSAEAPAADAAATDEAAADASASQGGTGPLVNADGEPLGNASISLTQSGATLVLIQAEGFPEGVHGVHLHMTGLCEGPAFESAGDHLGDGEHQHGVLSAEGPHPGDLPNAHVQADGVIAMEAFPVGLTLDMVFDEDGTALIVHADPDDYVTQPGGASGDRIACAVIEAGGDAGAAREEAEGSEAVEAQE